MFTMWEGLRRFRLEYHDVVSTLRNAADLLRLMALNIDGRDRAPPILAILLTPVFVGAYFYVFVFSMFYVVFFRETEDYVGEMVVFAVGMATTQNMVKLFSLYLNSGLLKQTVAAIVSCDNRVAAESRMYSNRLSHMRIVKRRAIIVWTMIMINGSVYGVRPFLLPGRHLVDDTRVLYGLEEKYESPNYELTLLFEEMATVMVVSTCATITALLIIFSGYIESQMLALSHEVLHLWDDARTMTIEDTSDLGKLQNQFIKNQLRSITQMHATSLKLLRLIERVFNISIAVEFTLVGMGLIAELLGGLENTYVEMPYALSQVIIDCYIGQQLVNASIKFRESVYFCGWEEFDVSNMKTVVMILQNSQKEMVLSAGGIAQLQYMTLMSVIKTIYTTYAGLRTTMNKEKD